MTASHGVQPQRVSLPLPLYKPIATWVLLGINVAVFALETLLGGSSNSEVLIRLGAKVNPLIATGEYWRLFTSMFLHIGIVHLLFNSYALVAVGTELERLLGAGRFLAIYLLSGLFGSLASYAFSDSLSAGASGAIFGIVGALVAYYVGHRERLGSWGRRRLANIAFFVGISLILGFTQPGIDNMAHLGGLVSGFALGWVLTPQYQVDPIGLRVVDRNGPKRYWPLLVLALVVLAGGIALVTYHERHTPASRLLQAQAAVERQAWDEAIAEVEQAIAQEPAQTDAYFYLGLARNNLGQPQLAAAAYESALALEPELPWAHWYLALTYLQLDRFAEALGHFETYLDLDPGAADKVQPYLDELRHIVP